MLNKIKIWLMTAIGAVGAIFAFGAIKKREGRKEMQSEVEDELKETTEATLRRMDGSNPLDAGSARERLRKRSAKR